MDKEFRKLYDVPQFKVVKVIKWHWQMWNEAENKFTKSDRYFKGATKNWLVECEDFMLNLSSSQFSSMLESCYTVISGKAEPEGRQFTVKTNGKQGKDVRYYINIAYDPEAPAEKTKEELPPTPTEVPPEPQNTPVSNEQTGYIPF